MFTRSIARLILALIIFCASLLFMASITTATATVRPHADLIVNPGESIQAAIDAANDGDTIIINAGDYTESLTLSKPVSLTGVNSDTTIIHAIAGQRVLTVTGATITNSVVISGLTFTGGTDSLGGGIYADTPLTVMNARFISNTASGGGGLYTRGATTVAHVDFISNVAQVCGGLNAIDSITVTLGWIEANRALTGSGGGFCANGPLYMADTHVINNSSSSLYDGGGGYVVSSTVIISSWFERNSEVGLSVNSLKPNASLTVSNSTFISNSGNSAGGGAVLYNSNAMPAVIFGSRFEGNYARDGGGLLSFRDTIVTNTYFVSNTAEHDGGGAALFYHSTVENSYFERNVSLTDVAGGLYGTEFVIRHTTFLSNSAPNGGALVGFGIDIADSHFEGNSANDPYASYGGGAITTFWPLSISHSQFVNNRSEREGGAIYAGSNTNLTNTRFINNSADQVGGSVYVTRTGDARIINALFAYNTSGQDGAALYFASTGNMTVSYATIADAINNPRSAIAVVSGTLGITNTIISNHAIGISNTGGLVTEDYNLFYGNVTNTVGVTMGAHSLVGDPHFVDPAHDDYHLAFGSAAIDHGVDAGVYTDLDGNIRPHGAGFDIGAYEFAGGTRYVATTGDDAGNGCLNSAVPCATLQHAIDEANDNEQVVVAAGLYTQSTTLSKPVSLTGVNSDTTIIHAIAGQRVLTVTGATITNSVVISGLTFTGGNAGYGGGIYADVPLTVMSSRFISNTAFDGGGLFIIGDANLSDVDFRDNIATDLGGGVNARNGTLNLTRAVFVHNTGSAVYSPNSPATIADSHFEQNSGGVGGAVWMHTTGASISHTDFISNTADYGGGGVTMVDGSIINSRFEGNTSQNYWGGGLYALGTTIVTGTDFISNTSNTQGGGAFFGNAQIFDSRFERNVALHGGGFSGGGGGLGGDIMFLSNTLVLSNTAYCSDTECGGGMFANRNTTILNSRFENNTAGNSGSGGGLYVDGFTTITDSQFFSNTASSGGGVWAGGVFLTGGRFEGNVSAGGTGGGLSTGSLTMTGTQFISNAAMCGGGAFAISPVIVNGGRFERNISNGSGGALCLSTLTLTGTAFINNSATLNGGAIFYSYSDADPIRDGRIVNALFSHNSANAGGTAMFVQARDSVTLLHATIGDTNLNSTSAVAIVSSTLSITNTIITNHAIGISNTGGTITEDYNLFYGNVTNTVGVTMGAHSLVGDPHFVDPAHDDYHLAFGSAAIDHGVDAGVYTDLDGNVRPHGAGFDIGAYEFTGGTRYVATTGDDASNFCLDQLAPCATVQHAIDVANDGEQILIASGLYTQSATLSKPVSLTGVNSDTTIIHAVAGQRVLTVTGSTISTSVVISGLTFTGGYADKGGGIYSDVPLRVISSRFISNSATTSGGGLFAGTSTMINVEFISNATLLDLGISPNGGGGAFLTNGVISSSRFENNATAARGGGLSASQDLVVTNTSFISNYSSWEGGGLFAFNAVIDGSRFERNVCRYLGGGGLNAAITSISNTQFISNTAQWGGGGGAYSDRMARLYHSRFENNQCMNQCSGGGLYVPRPNWPDSPLSIEQTLFFNNAAHLGGGAYIGNTEGAFTLSDSQFISNSAIVAGGGLAQGNGQHTEISNTLFVRNSSELYDAAAMFFSQNGSISLTNVTIADVNLNPHTAISVENTRIYVTNTIIANHAVGIGNIGGIVTEDYNLFYGNVTNTLGVITGAHSLVGDPRFIDPAHDDYHLAFGSAAIDHGVDAGVYTDLDSDPRPFGPGFDIGAYEYQGPIYRAFLPLIQK